MAKSVADIAIERIDGQIADLNRAKDLILLAVQETIGTDAPAPKKRGRKKKPGLPAAAVDAEANRRTDV